MPNAPYTLPADAPAPSGRQRPPGPPHQQQQQQQAAAPGVAPSPSGINRTTTSSAGGACARGSAEDLLAAMGASPSRPPPPRQAPPPPPPSLPRVAVGRPSGGGGGGGASAPADDSPGSPLLVHVQGPAGPFSPRAVHILDADEPSPPPPGAATPPLQPQQPPQPPQQQQQPQQQGQPPGADWLEEAFGIGAAGREQSPAAPWEELRGLHVSTPTAATAAPQPQLAGQLPTVPVAAVATAAAAAGARAAGCGRGTHVAAAAQPGRCVSAWPVVWLQRRTCVCWGRHAHWQDSQPWRHHRMAQARAAAGAPRPAGLLSSVLLLAPAPPAVERRSVGPHAEAATLPAATLCPSAGWAHPSAAAQRHHAAFHQFNALHPSPLCPQGAPSTLPQPAGSHRQPQERRPAAAPAQAARAPAGGGAGNGSSHGRGGARAAGPRALQAGAAQQRGLW